MRGKSYQQMVVTGCVLILLSTIMDLTSSDSTISTTVSNPMNPNPIMNLTSSESTISTTISNPMNPNPIMNMTSSESTISTTVSNPMNPNPIRNLTSSESTISTTVSNPMNLNPVMNLTSSDSILSTTVSNPMNLNPVMNLTSSDSTISTTVSNPMNPNPVMNLTSSDSTISTTVSNPMNPNPIMNMTSSESTISTISTTVEVFEIPPEQYNCLPINDSNAIVNSTSVAEYTVVHVSCQAPYKLIVPLSNTEVFTCLAGRWIPVTPTCKAGGDISAPVGVIVGCTIGGFICLVLVIVALFMLHKSMKERKEQRERNKEFNDKMDQIGFYINSTFQDPVGMPVLTMDTRDTELRGRVAPTNNQSASSEKRDLPDVVNLGADLF